MTSQKLYISKVLPHLKNFKTCEIYKYEIKKIEQKLAESLNKKNMYEVLDIPDFRHVKNSKLLPGIIKLAIKKLKLVKKEKPIEIKNTDIIEIDNTEYQLVTFSSGEIPKIKFKNKNLIIFMYQPDFNKIFYCGKLYLNKVTNKENISEFINFEILEI